MLSTCEKYKVHCEAPQCSSASLKEVLPTDLQHKVTLLLVEDLGKNRITDGLYFTKRCKRPQVLLLHCIDLIQI